MKNLDLKVAIEVSIKIILGVILTGSIGYNREKKAW